LSVFDNVVAILQEIDAEHKHLCIDFVQWHNLRFEAWGEKLS